MAALEEAQFSFSGVPDYIPELIAANGEQSFASQCIPTNPALLAPEHYREFLAKRRGMVAERLNAFLS